MKSLLLLPVGYPLRAGEEAPFLTTDDPTLFQHYARSQWLGLIVKKGNFLFDSLLFPDYAFRVVTVEPEESQITKDTKISLFSEQTSDPLIVAKQYNLSFSDVIGQQNAKDKCYIIAKFLSDSKLIRSIWAPKNILFWGPPGNGKTMMAKALSKETEHSIYLVKATDLMGIYVGDGARKIKNLYAEARKESPAIDQPTMIDSAILRRFEELIEFKPPNPSERKQILIKYADSSPIKFNRIQWNKIVQRTQGWSGRELQEKLIKNTIHSAILQEKPMISMEDIEKILNKITDFTESLIHYS
ncbi:MAG: AAA family ATPase [Candidatus Hodarchaeales archaeon]